MTVVNMVVTQSPQQLPACERCRTKKIKCDRKAPKCSACTNSSTDCVLVDFNTKAQYSREYIAQLENQAEKLDQQIDQPTTPESNLILETGQDHEPVTPAEPAGINNTAPNSRYMGQGSGFSFLKNLFADANWRADNTELLQKLSQRPNLTDPAIKPNELPPIHEAESLLSNFLAGPHVQSPIVYQHEARSIFRKVYQSPELSSSVSHGQLCQLYLIFAIGAISMYRNGRHSAHPVGYYLSAMQHFDHEFLAQGLVAIQNLLLVARFAIFYHIGVSIWNISQICIRMCIEHELHLQPQITISAELEQIQRRIFWQSYIIDRYSGMTLGRPFAISDSDIEVELPADVEDEDILMSGSSLNDIDPSSGIQQATKMSAFLALIRLRRISSKIYSRFSHETIQDTSSRHERRLLDSGRVYVDLNQFLADLKEWRLSTLAPQQPSCLYEREEWYDFLHERERLMLVRQVIDHLPQQSGRPPRDLLQLCQRCAIQVIVIYYSLFQQGHIAYTRSYFHTLFTAGLSVMCCTEARSVVNTPISSPTAEGRASAFNAVSYCHELLNRIGSNLQDVDVYVAVFGALRQKFVLDLNLNSLANSTAAQPELTTLAYLDNIRSSNTAPALAHDMSTPLVMEPGSTLGNTLYSEQQHSIGPNLGPNQHIATSEIGMNENVISTVNDIPLDEYQIFSTGEPNFWDSDTLWNINMEAGLNEYVYGDINTNDFFMVQLNLNWQT